jgi:hypothetical protein
MTAFTDQKIDLASGPVHFVKGGDGPALLHLHSAAGPRLSPAIEKLAAKHTFLCRRCRVSTARPRMQA